MSRRTFTIFIIIVVVIGILAAYFFLFANKNVANQTEDALKNFFPFGKGGKTVNVDQQNNNNQVPPPTNNNSGGTTIPRLRKVSDNPVVGYAVTQKEIPVDPNIILPDVPIDIPAEIV